MGLQESCDRQTVRLVPLHAKRQRAQPSKHQPGGEWIEDSARLDRLSPNEGIHLLLSPGDHAGYDVAVTAQILRCRMQYQVDPEIERVLEVGRCPGVVCDRHD